MGLLPACQGRQESGEAASARRPSFLEIVAPEPGEVITSGEVILAVAASKDLQNLKFSLGGRDLTRRFKPGGERNLKRGGGWLYVAWLASPADLDAGPQQFMVEAAGRTARQAGVRFQIKRAALVVEYQVVEEHAGGPVPVAARLTFIGLDGTPDPDLAQTSAGRVDPAGRERNRAFTDTGDGQGEVGLPEGKYAVVASHGVRSSVEVIRVQGSGQRRLRFVLHPLSRRPDEWSCDFHVHGLASPDSALPPAIRLRAYRAADMDLLVAADHNRITDYRPFQGTDSPLLAVPGVEAGLQGGGGSGSPHSIGHWTLWPLAGGTSEAGASRERLVVKTMPPLMEGEAYEVYRRFALDATVARRLEEAGETDLTPIIQLNHPRGVEPPLTGRIQRDKAYFEALDLDPDRPVPASDDGGPNSFLRRSDSRTGLSNGSFDAIELYNRASLSLYLEVRRDYFALLRAGMAATSVGNTDSHSLAAMPAGAPVNLVSVTPAAGGRFRDRAATLAALMTAVRAGHLVSTTGPDLHLTVVSSGGAGGPGDLVAAADGQITARLEVTAPDWIPVEEVRWYLDGKLQKVEPLDSPVHRKKELPADHGVSRLRRWSLTRRFHTTDDGFLFVEAGEKLPADPRIRPPAQGVYGKVIPRQWSLAFANPVRIDADGVAGWKPVVRGR